MEKSLEQPFLYLQFYLSESRHTSIIRTGHSLDDLGAMMMLSLLLSCAQLPSYLSIMVQIL